MRHGKRINHLGRTAPHRKAMLSNMASSLILHKRITTTIAKAKALRPYIEPLLTKAKEDTTHSRRVVFSYLQNKESVRELFDVVSEKISNRPGGYTRIIKTGTRLGDSAEMCIMELVDYNELLLEETDSKKTKTRRGSRRKSKSEAQAAAGETKGTDTAETKPIADQAENAPDKVVEDKEEPVDNEAATASESSKAEENKAAEADKTEVSAEKKDVAEQAPGKVEKSDENPAEDTSSEETKKE